MLIRTPPKFKFSQITPETAYIGRRALLAGAGAAALVAAVPGRGGAAEGEYTVDAPLTSFEDATTYNNFYEFGLDKGDPAKHAGQLTTEPWSVVIDGLVGKPGTYSVADLIAPSAVEERVYRLRCVEGWSMVLPWSGVPLAGIIARAEPQGAAKYVAFETLVRPEEMPGQSGMFQTLDWPYVEGLRLDEAMHPLALIVTGLYGKPLPNQNGAPLRLVVPWKYGFKGVKSIVRMTLVEAEPPTTWNLQAPGEYGFYANVNPAVDHPRWSQASERVIGAGFLSPKRDTEMFNGYAEEVAHLYGGMDLQTYF